MERNRYSLTPVNNGEFYALERQARQARAEAMGRMLVNGFRALSRALSSMGAGLRGEVKQHA